MCSNKFYRFYKKYKVDFYLTLGIISFVIMATCTFIGVNEIAQQGIIIEKLQTRIFEIETTKNKREKLHNLLQYKKILLEKEALEAEQKKLINKNRTLSRRLKDLPQIYTPPKSSEVLVPSAVMDSLSKKYTKK